MGTVQVMVVSDSHLSESTPEAKANWDAVVGHVARRTPDLVVHAGDISADGSRRTDDLVYARAHLDRLDAPLAVIPGNHDVGDLPGPGSSPGPPVHAESIALFRAVFGSDRFSVPVGRWRIVGIDAQACGAGGDVEADHWAWLEGELASLAPATPVVLVSHRPVMPAPGDRERPALYVRPGARARLVGLLRRVDTRLVVSGHMHERLRHDSAGLDQLWAPTTWALGPDGGNPPLGEKQPGTTLLELHDDGRVGVTTETPEGMSRHVIGGDVADPYGILPSPSDA